MRLSRTAGITLARVDPALSMAIVRRLRDARLGPTEGPCGGTGRRARLKIEFRKECWFDSGQGHQASLLRSFALRGQLRSFARSSVAWPRRPGTRSLPVLPEPASRDVLTLHFERSVSCSR